MSGEHRLSAIIGRLGALVFEVAPDGVITSCAGSAHELGVAPGEAAPEVVRELLGDAPWAAEAFARARAGETARAEGRFRDRPLALELVPLGGPGARAEGVVGLVRAPAPPDDELARRVRRLERLTERGPLVLFSQLLRGDEVRLQTSPNAAALFGFSAAQLAERGFWHSRIHPDDLARLLRDRAHLRGQESYAQEFRFRHADGEWRWLRAENSLVYDASGALTEVHGFLLDVTERQAARAYARQSIDFESRVIDEAEIGIVVFDTDMRYRLWNPYIAKVVGIDAGEVVGKTPWQVFAGLPRALLRRDIKRALAGVVTSGERHLVNRETGRKVILAVTLAPMQAADGELLGVVGLMRDISEQRRLQEAYESSERSFRALIDEAPDGMLVEREGLVVYANRALYALLGRDGAGDGAGVVGRRFVELIHGEPGGLEAASARDYAFRAQDGREIAVELRTTRISFEGEPATLAICRDLTERRALQAQLMAADRLSSMGALAAGVGHEINNPLAAILANLDAALRDLEAARAGRPEVREDPQVRAALDPLRDARDAAVRLKDIARDLKLFARADDEQLGVVDLVQLVDSTLRLAHNEIRHRARLRRDIAPGVPRVRVNEARLGQVLLNLIINATQAIAWGDAAGNEIAVLLRAEPGFARVEVHDTGVGIAPALLGRIFEPFFTTKPAGVGTGLGLAICKRLVEAAGGTIEAESEPGRGSVFRVRLPAAVEETEAARTDGARGEGEGPSARRRGSVLVVDDDANVARSIGRALRRWHDVAIETDAEAALRRLRDGRERFDVILCDIMMPAMTGMDFHAALVPFAREVADEVVFMSGGVFSSAARDFVDRVPNTLVEKPFDPLALHALIEERVRRKDGGAG